MPVFAVNVGNARRFRAAAWRRLLLAACLPLLPACTGDPPASSPGSPSAAPSDPAGQGTAVAAKPQTEDQCQVIVDSLHETYALQRMEFTASTADAVARLNDWLRECAPAATDPALLPAALEASLVDSQRALLAERQFSLRDGQHLRDCTMLRAVARHALAPDAADTSELDRVIRGFEYVARSVALVPRRTFDLPMTPYDILLFGQGTAADRAWVFAGLLRQERIDAVLLTPSAADPDASNPATPFLVGVLLESGVHLFDPRLGVPIPAPGDGPAGPTVATLAQAADDPGVLARLNAREGAPYSIRGIDLQTLSVSLITDAGYWTSRMRQLQEQFSGAAAMVISDPPADAGEAPGQWSRAAEAGRGRWSSETLRVWRYPEQQIVAGLRLTEDQAQARGVALAPFRAFKSPLVDQNGQLLQNSSGFVLLTDEERWKDPSVTDTDIDKNRQSVRTTTNSQLRARLAHLDGDFAQAIQGYREVHQRARMVAGTAGVHPADAVPHQRAVEDSAFWTALCKFEEGDFRVAADSCRRYLRQQAQQPQPGVWARQCQLLLALSLAAEQNYSGAVEALPELEPDDPEFASIDWRRRQWSAAEQASQ